MLFWALTKSHMLLKRYRPLDSTDLRLIFFLLFNMRIVSQFQFLRLDIYQSNCQHHCGLTFILSSSWQAFWFIQHWKVNGEAYILPIPLSNSWQILFSKWSVEWGQGCWNCLISQYESCLNLNHILVNMPYVAKGCSQTFLSVAQESKVLNTMPSRVSSVFKKWSHYSNLFWVTDPMSLHIYLILMWEQLGLLF